MTFSFNVFRLEIASRCFCPRHFAILIKSTSAGLPDPVSAGAGAGAGASMDASS